MVMDSERISVNSTEYFPSGNLENFFLPNTNKFFANNGFASSTVLNNPVPNPHSFIRSTSLGNELHYPYPGMDCQPQPFNYFHSPEKCNSFNSSRFNWSQDTKPEFSFSSNSGQPQPACFNADSYSNLPTGSFGYKRKTRSPPPIPHKQYITEEKMAEHMSQLHISSVTDISSTENEPSRERRLYMCEEMQRLQAESIIPIQLLEKIPRPCTALIPWTPPVIAISTKEKNNNVVKRLYSSVQQLTENNRMDTSQSECDTV